MHKAITVTNPQSIYKLYNNNIFPVATTAMQIGNGEFRRAMCCRCSVPHGESSCIGFHRSTATVFATACVGILIVMQCKKNTGEIFIS